MRWLVSGTLLAVGTALIYFFVSGHFVEALTTMDPGGRSVALIDGLWTMTPSNVAALVFGVAAIVFGVNLHFWRENVARSPQDPMRWAPLLQSALCLNVLFAGVLILSISLAVRSSVPMETVGHLFLLSLLVTLAGSFFTFALLWMKKSRVLYASAVVIHLVEVGSLSAIFVMGFGE